jgi:murein DD-endopeptidase MepM/ murein hydrolase activator NlpD
MFSRTRTSFQHINTRSSRTLWLRLVACCALIAPAIAGAGSGCGEQVLCIQPVATPGGTELRAVNQGGFPITLKFELEPVNLQVDGAETSRWVLEPGRPVALAQLRPLDPTKPSDFRYRTLWSRGDYRARHDDSVVYGLPYQPGPGFMVSQGYNGHFSHHGDSQYAVDFAMPEGTPIVAAREGVVISVRGDSTVGGPDRAYEDKANYVVVQHQDGTFAEYLHLQPNGVRVAQGERVSRGQLLGFSGNTGFSGGPHLHFMVAGATADGGRRSFAVRFQTAEGVVAQLQAGRSYPSVEGALLPVHGTRPQGIAATVDGGRSGSAAGTIASESPLSGSRAPAVGAGEAAEAPESGS